MGHASWECDVGVGPCLHATIMDYFLILVAAEHRTPKGSAALLNTRDL